MNNTTTDIKFPTCGTTESNDSIEIKKNFLAKNASTIKVITYLLGIIISIILGSSLANFTLKNYTKQVYDNAFDKGYNVGYNVAKIEATNSEEPNNNISKAFQYVPQK